MNETTEVLSLTDFLLARIAEDEARADRFPDVLPIQPHEANPPMMDSLGQPIIQPRRRLLAECEAKRRIVESMPSIAKTEKLGAAALRILALPYADHPDYREWRP